MLYILHKARTYTYVQPKHVVEIRSKSVFLHGYLLVVLCKYPNAMTSKVKYQYLFVNALFIELFNIPLSETPSSLV
jgi:hypothetical protein